MPLNANVAVGLVDELLVIVSLPVSEPAAVGANSRFRFRDWPGLSVTGKLDPDTENPVPVTVAELTVTGAVPLDVKVTVCAASVFMATEPKEMLVALTVRVGVVDAVAGLNWIP